MGNPVGSFIWYELMTTDPDAATAFYGAVVGWTVARDPHAGTDGPDYRMIVRSDGGHAGGMLHLTPKMCENGAHSAWFPYLYVTDVDSEAMRIVEKGGHILMEPTDLAVGRIALIHDPQGVPIYLMTPIPPEGMENAASDVFSSTEVQRVAWNELASPDLEASKAFYARHFGFEFNNSMPMGELGDYCFIDHGGQCLGAIMQRPDPAMPALWQFYFRVPSVTQAKAAVEANGGKVLMDIHQVPGGDWIIVASDPQGAVFGVVGAKGD